MSDYITETGESQMVITGVNCDICGGRVLTHKKKVICFKCRIKNLTNDITELVVEELKNDLDSKAIIEVLETKAKEMKETNVKIEKELAVMNGYVV